MGGGGGIQFGFLCVFFKGGVLHLYIFIFIFLAVGRFQREREIRR